MDQLDTQSPTGTINSKGDIATDIARKMLTAGLSARAARFTQIKKNEDLYMGITSPAIKGRNNVPFDTFVMSGYMDTLLANITEEVSIKYNRTREQDKMSADKMTAVWENQTAPDKLALNDKMLDMKTLMVLAGRGFMKLYVESAPKFKTDLTVCDHWDMVTEAKGGGDLDTHLYKFQMNIFRTKKELMDGAKSGFYDKAQVIKLIQRYQSPDDFKKNEEYLGMKADRWANFGISTELNSYVGTKLYRLVEGVIYHDGGWKYIVFSAETETWIRYQPLEEVFAHAKQYPGRGPWVSATTKRHPFLFWNAAPADDIRPVAYTMKKIVNLTLDNLEKRNWDQTAYDPKIFTDPAQLLWRQDGLVRATLKPGQDIAKGIYRFQTPDTTAITINLVSWLDGFLGQKTGITPDAQGSSAADQVGILVNNLQQLSKRLRLTNKTIRKMYVDLGTIFDWGTYEHLREPYAVKLIGNDGIRWEEEFTREDSSCDFSITVTSGMEEDEKNSEISDKRIAGFSEISKNPLLMQKINPEWLLRERFKTMGYSDEQTRVALDTQNNGNEEVLAKAAQIIQDCIEGKEYLEMYRGATTGFIRKIINFAQDNFPLIPDEIVAKLPVAKQKKYMKDMEKFNKLINYAQEHVQIAIDNMARAAVAAQVQMGLNSPGGQPLAGKEQSVPIQPEQPMQQQTPAIV